MEFARLVPIEYDLQQYFPDFSWNESPRLNVGLEPVLLVDPIYLADVYNETSDDASYVRNNGTFLVNFGGDWSGPVWLTETFLLIPTSWNNPSPPIAPVAAVTLCEEIGCDSGSFVLLPLLQAIHVDLRRKIDECIELKNAAMLNMPPGSWDVKFEQFTPPRENMTALYRNIVVLRVGR